MRINERFTYSASPADVFAMMTDPAFQSQKLTDSGATGQEANVSVDEQSGKARIVTRRDLPSQDLPDFAKRFVGGALSIREVYDFAPAEQDGSRDGTLEVTVDGAPIGMRGTVRVAPDGSSASSTVVTIEGDLKVRVPLVGNKVEQAAAPWVTKGMQTEARTGQAWLAQRG